MLKRWKQYRFLFEELVKRDFKKKYKRTILGMGWSLLSPLLMLLVMRLVFTQFFGRNTPHYTTYLFCGNLIFSYFSEATKSGMSSLMENAKVFTADGWFRTGDAGLFDHSGSLVLTERIKDLFKTSNGKYIAPQAIESRLGEDRYIEQVAVIGDQRKYVTAIIIPAFGALKEYAQKKGITFDSIEDLVQNSEIRKFIAERIERMQKGLAGFEKIKRFTLLPREFSIETGELTNTLKIRRPVINSLYANEIEAMYC